MHLIKPLVLSLLVSLIVIGCGAPKAVDNNWPGGSTPYVDAASDKVEASSGPIAPADTSAQSPLASAPPSSASQSESSAGAEVAASSSEPPATAEASSPPTAEISPRAAAQPEPRAAPSSATRAEPPIPPGTPESPTPPQSVVDQSWVRFLPDEGWAPKRLQEMGFGPKNGRRTVVLDPGNGGPEVGSAYGSQDGGSYISEKNANLEIAKRVKYLLEGAGYRVILTRESDTRAYTVPDSQANAAFSGTRADLQGRVDIANAAEADIFVSIHNNGSSDGAQRGTEVWYSSDRPFADQSLKLAKEVLDSLVIQLRGAGYSTTNRGIKDGAHFRVFQGQSFPLFVLGRPRMAPRPTRATNMPGVLGETLFLSNASEGALLRNGAILDAIAMGYKDGIARYFAWVDGGR